MAERTVNARQLAVLEWIVEGCPAGVMTGTSHKATALALQIRRLAVVTRKRGVWKAESTAAGRHFLERGSYPVGHWTSFTPDDADSEDPATPRATDRPGRQRAEGHGAATG